MGAERAEALIASAEAEAEAVRRAAGRERAAALEEGRAEGLRAGQAEIAACLAGLAEAEERWRTRAEAEALDLAVEMARRIIGQELRCDPAAACAGAAAALRAAGRWRVLRLRLHPEAVAAAGDGGPALVAALAGGALELVADPALAPGDVVVETEGGRIDGRIGSRLESFRAALGRDAA
jgi:flagellar biosynthesis/type III secretory pathway protein FliH